MKQYNIDFTEEAIKDISKLKKSEKNSYKKLVALLEELIIHPKTGTGKPEQLKYIENCWSRRISSKHRLVYKIDDEKIIIFVLSSFGHYNNK